MLTGMPFHLARGRHTNPARDTGPLLTWVGVVVGGVVLDGPAQPRHLPPQPGDLGGCLCRSPYASTAASISTLSNPWFRSLGHPGLACEKHPRRRPLIVLLSFGPWAGDRSSLA